MAQFGKKMRHWRRLAPIALLDRLQQELLGLGIGVECLVALRRQDSYRRPLRQLAVELDATANDSSRCNSHACILPTRFDKSRRPQSRVSHLRRCRMFDIRWSDDPRDRNDEPGRRGERHRDRDDDAGPHVGRGPGSHKDQSDGDTRPRDDERWPERDRDPREHDPRDVFVRHVDLPRGRERELVHDARDRAYTLRGSESRTLATVGSFRVVSGRDLRDHNDRAADPRSGGLRHLREQGLVQTVRLDGRRDVAVVLTDRGRDLLESNRGRDCERQPGGQMRWLVASEKREQHASLRRAESTCVLGRVNTPLAGSPLTRC